jgi:undecaprenyl-diphosphatase
VLVPLAMLIALSRVVLGLHYPSDVLAGAALGEGIAQAAGLLPLA